ncbi:Glucan 1,4-alpha-glucosidase SusB [Pontiella desulfatans]|uniref:Glucan 1,4-alpha-glucosidase SusB n=1 Tax=Pontiella desulfatans TaxID=2750659 RepID=A0A6C2U189_PONDE|nr:glycoside hydrolase family 97 catalytic domain-containing protein [Pontiella desulfatans]VGO13146.1 Glucan 1,4-alpha-glucosidase SusB [Pontiella desulfatans]
MQLLRPSLGIAMYFVCAGVSAGETLRSPGGQIEVMLLTEAGHPTYSVNLNGEPIIAKSALGLKPDAAANLEVAEITRSSGDETWKPVWGSYSEIRDHYNEVRLKVEGPSAQTIICRAYDDGIAIRYQLPASGRFSDEFYAHEATEVALVSEKPTAWFPLSQVLVSDAVDLNTWEPGDGKISKNVRQESKPARIRTPFTVKLSDQACISVHEAAVVHSDEDGLSLNGNTLTVLSNMKTAGGSVTPWRTIQIAQKPGGLIASSLLVNLNKPCELEDPSWIKPGVTLWDWRVHGAHADDGFVYGLNTESYIRFIDFAAETGVEYLMLDAEWYGPERDAKSDPKTAIPDIDIEKICAHARAKGVGIWLYVNTKALAKYDLDETFAVYKKWGVVGIKHGFLGGGSRTKNEFSHAVAKKCAEYHILYVVHESEKPSGVERTWPNILSYEYVNSMLDSATRPSATPSRVINNLFVFGLAGPVDRSCGMYDLDSTFIP